MAQGRRSTLPLEERFFLGGGTTLRGFSTNSVGPANFARRPEINHPTQTESVVDGLALYDNSGQWAATGGDAMAAATMEIRIPLPILGFRRLDNVDLVFFSDVGHVGFLDSTVVTSEGIDDLARFLGCGDKVKELTAKAMGGSMPYHEALELRLNAMRPSETQVATMLREEPLQLTPGIADHQAVAQGLLLMPALRALSCSAHWT